MTYKTSDKTGLQLLVHFFTTGNVSNVSTALPYQREKRIRAPCLFAVPRSLWKDTDGPDGRELVMGGTCAMVFRVSFNKLGELLKEVSKVCPSRCWILVQLDTILHVVSRCAASIRIGLGIAIAIRI
jgi:hypothetical protein